MSEFDRNKYKEIAKESSGTDKRFLNVKCYTYCEGAKKVTISPAEKNTNPNCDDNKKWINKPGISGMSKEEVLGLIKSLEKIVCYLD